MKKTILFLMNGFGVEQSDSYSVYNSNLMPNLDRYTKEYLFSTIETKAYDMVSGYRKFSTGMDLPLSYSLIDNLNNDFTTNQNILFYINSIKENSKIQLYLFLENEYNLEHLKQFVSSIRKIKNNPIYLHIVLTAKDNENFIDIEKIINKIIYDYKEVKIATIIGANTLASANQVSYLNLLQNEVGEKWRELNKKFLSLSNAKVLPIDTKEFYMENGFKIDDNDSFFFFNYEYTDLTNFVNSIKTQECFSLFQINGVKYPMFAFPKSGISTTNSLNKINAKAVVLTSKQNVSLINYYLCGLENVTPNNIVYGSIDNDILLNQEYIKSIISNEEYNLIIIDYHIDDSKDINELNQKLSKLDSILGYLHDYVKEKEYTLFISSLYGMKKEIQLDNFAKEVVNFSTKLPVVVIDNVFTKVNFRLDTGNTYNLAHTVYTNINKEYDINDVLIKKKGFLSNLLKK